jgi:hypothetical protein
LLLVSALCLFVFVLCLVYQCFLYLWIVHSWLPLRFFLKRICIENKSISETTVLSPIILSLCCCSGLIFNPFDIILFSHLHIELVVFATLHFNMTSLPISVYSVTSSWNLSWMVTSLLFSLKVLTHLLVIWHFVSLFLYLAWRLHF